jgi:F-type H+-transporting ATPase subunit epsilon
VPTHVELVTPERVLYSGEAGFVVLRTDGGEIMFLPGHADFIAAVDICVVRIDAAGGDGPAPPSGGGGAGEVRAAVAGGFVHVADNQVTVLAGVAELADDIDVERARRALEAASADSASGAGDSGAGRRDRDAAATPSAPASTAGGAGVAGEEPPSDDIVETPTMRALLYPEDPVVRARRAANRLDTAGEADAGTAAIAAGAAPAASAGAH